MAFSDYVDEAGITRLRATGGGGGGGGGSASLLGPFPVTFETAGFQTDGAPLGAFLPASALVAAVLVSVHTDFFNGAANNAVQAGVFYGDIADGDTQTLVTVAGSSNDEPGAWDFVGAPEFGIGQVIVTDADTVKLYAVAKDATDPLLSGSADVYALVVALA